MAIELMRPIFVKSDISKLGFTLGKAKIMLLFCSQIVTSFTFYNYFSKKTAETIREQTSIQTSDLCLYTAMTFKYDQLLRVWWSAKYQKNKLLTKSILKAYSLLFFIRPIGKQAVLLDLIKAYEFRANIYKYHKRFKFSHVFRAYELLCLNEQIKQKNNYIVNNLFVQTNQQLSQKLCKIDKNE